IHALRQEPVYRAQKPPSSRDADRNEARRSLAAFYVVVGFPEEALRITEKAMVSPDRRAHQSRDPAQDLIVTALVDREARRLEAERILEQAAGEPFYLRPVRWAQAAAERFRGWLSGREAAKLLAEEGRLEGTFKIGSKESAIMPPWLASDVTEIVGAGLVEVAVEAARKGDDRPASGAYYDAFLADAALGVGDDARAFKLAERAAGELARGEELLRARMHVVAARAAEALGKEAVAREHYEEAFQIDPGIFRRLRLPIPATFRAGKSDIAEDVADILERSPRFEQSGVGFEVRVDGDGTACLVGGSGAVLGCAGPDEAKQDAEDAKRLAEGDSKPDTAPLATQIARSFHRRAFAPRIDLSQADARSLDGSNRVSRDPLEGLR
ncbi:MAG: hypothetical protein KC417_04220, partial [Myxococcales bacterium]|nr:hypothetical protein [Myxococcales bacterium]